MTTQQQQQQQGGKAVSLTNQDGQSGAQPANTANTASQAPNGAQSGGQSVTGNQADQANTGNQNGGKQQSGQDGQSGAQPANTANTAGQAQGDGQSGQDGAQTGDQSNQDGDQSNGQADGDPVPYHRFKEVNDQLRQARSDLERLPTLESENMRLRVALERGIPLALAERLQGDTVEALNADADSLLAIVGTNEQQQAGSPGVPPPSDGNTPEALPDFSKMKPSEIREWSNNFYKR